MSKRPSTTPPSSGPSWPSYRALVEARDAARRADVNLPWLLWLMLVQPRLALARLKESGATPLLMATMVVLLAALVQAATIYSRNALLVSTLDNIAQQNLGAALPNVQGLLAPLLAIGRLSPTTLVLLITAAGLLLWPLISLLTWGYLRAVGLTAPPGFRNVVVVLAFCAMPMLAEAALLPFLLLLDGGVLYAIETIFKLLLVPWTLGLVYLALRSIGAKRGQAVSVMLLVFFSLQFVVTTLLGTALWQSLTALIAQVSPNIKLLSVPQKERKEIP